MDDTPIELLRLHRSIRGLDEQELISITRHTNVVHYQKGDVIHSSEDRVENLSLVIHGRLKMSIVLNDKTERTLEYFGRDDQFGLLALLEDELIPINVVADENTTLLCIPKEGALELYYELPLWGRNLLRSIGPRLRAKLLGEKRVQRPRIVALIHSDDSFRHLTQSLVHRLTDLEESVGLLSDHDETLAGISNHSATNINMNGQLKPPAEIRNIVTQWADRDRIIFDIRADRITENLTRLQGACDAIFWVSNSNSKSIEQLTNHLAPMIQASPGLKDRTYVVWQLPADEPVGPYVPGLFNLCKQDFKVHWDSSSDSKTCTRHSGIERIIHSLRGISIGLALGGGAARGMAHLGVFQVLEESGISIDHMSGTSAGALAGINYAGGYSPDFLINAFANDLKPAWYYRLFPSGDLLYLLKKYRLGGWDRMLRKYLHSWRLEQLPIPFSSVAVDLVRASEVVSDQGDAVHAVLESINLPLISRPICRDGMVLVDGGILNVVPADVLINQGSNIVISIDVAARIRFEFAGIKSDTPTSQMKIPTTLQTSSRVRTVQDRNIRSVGGTSADLIIQPDVSEVNLADFKSTREIAKIGRSAAEDALPELKRILKRLDPQLFAD